jgi:hypothetical protein
MNPEVPERERTPVPSAVGSRSRARKENKRAGPGVRHERGRSFLRYAVALERTLNKRSDRVVEEGEAWIHRKRY